MADFPPKVLPWNSSEDEQQIFKLNTNEATLITENLIEAIRTGMQGGALGLITNALEQLYPNVQGGLNALIKEYIIEVIWNKLSEIPGNNRPPQLFLTYKNEFLECYDLRSAKKIQCIDAYVDPTERVMGFDIGPVSAQLKAVFHEPKVIPLRDGLYSCNNSDQDMRYSRLFRYRMKVDLQLTGNISWSFGRNFIREQWACTHCCSPELMESERQQ